MSISFAVAFKYSTDNLLLLPSYSVTILVFIIFIALVAVFWGKRNNHVQFRDMKVMKFNCNVMMAACSPKVNIFNFDLHVLILCV